MEAPILVTGSHRSGTTWVGKVLAASPGVAYVHEPFNPQRAPGWMGGRLPHWYLYVCPENEGPYAPLVEEVLRLRYPIARDLARLRTARQAGQAALEWARSVATRARSARPLLKDPIALFSAEWLAQRFGMTPVVMVRHPAAFAGSLKRLGWTFDFRNWSQQDLLLRDLLAPYAQQIRRFAGEERDVVDQSILMWNAIHHVIRGYRDRHPDWTFVKHEELAEAPLEGFRELAGRVGLVWGPGLRAATARLSSERNVGEVPTWLHRRVKRNSRAAARTWVTRLAEEERERVRAGTAEVASAFYTEADWVPRPA
ncbi:MAG: sulfotransferase [Actinomycetota bacterium]